MSVPHSDCPGCQALQILVADLQAQLAALNAQVAQLQARLNQNSQNSSRPPSSDPPRAPKRPPTLPRSDRKRGGQPGHKGAFRLLKPVDAVDLLVPLIPDACAHCHTAFSGELAGNALPPRRHQVVDLPPKLTLTTEYQCHARSCRTCGKLTWAALPEGVSRRLVGPRLQAFCALLVGACHVTRRPLQQLLQTAFDLPISLGCLSALEAHTANALAPSYEEAHAAVRAAPCVNADETSWRSGRERLWLWLAATPRLACFRIDPSRSRAAFERLLEPRAGRTLTSDRYGVYRHGGLCSWQICWAHLLRDFQGLIESKDGSSAHGALALEMAHAMFGLWHAFVRGEIERGELQERLRPIQARLLCRLRRARRSEAKAAASLSRELLRCRKSLWTFATVEGVEPTNNAAERALRPAVIWRKRSYGHEGASGQAFVERMLTVVGSLRLQGRETLGFLEGAIRAWSEGRAGPSLLPGRG
jgi:transposase